MKTQGHPAQCLLSIGSALGCLQPPSAKDGGPIAAAMLASARPSNTLAHFERSHYRRDLRVPQTNVLQDVEKGSVSVASVLQTPLSGRRTKPGVCKTDATGLFRRLLSQKFSWDAYSARSVEDWSSCQVLIGHGLPLVTVLSCSS